MEKTVETVCGLRGRNMLEPFLDELQYFSHSEVTRLVIMEQNQILLESSKNHIWQPALHTA